MRIIRNQRGFTLIELVMIIVILGILAAVAIPRYIDLQTDAENAAIKGLYGHIQSAYGITIADVKRRPTISEVNANITGNPGDLTVNGSATSVQLDTADNANTILGGNRVGSFAVTTEGAATGGAATIISIEALTVADVP